MAKADYKFDMRDLQANLKRMREEDHDHFERELRNIVPIFVNTAAKYTPPSIKSKDIPQKFYKDGYRTTSADRTKDKGQRKIFDLKKSVKEGAPHSALYGRLLKQGYKFIVFPRHKIMRTCKTLEEAQRYAHISNRGLLRAAWGLMIPSTPGIKDASVSILKLIEKRPELNQLSNMNKILVDTHKLEVSITNEALPSKMGTNPSKTGENYAYKVINDRLSVYFLRKDHKL